MATERKKKPDLCAKDLMAQMRAQRALADLATLGEKVVNAFGGMDEFATELKLAYSHPDTTPATKARILADITDLIGKVAKQNADQVVNDLGLLSDADLDAAAAEIIGHLNPSGETHDDSPPPADTEPPPAPPPAGVGPPPAAAAVGTVIPDDGAAHPDGAYSGWPAGTLGR